MKASAPQRAQRKRRKDSGIVGQATTDEPIDTARSAVLCYEHARTCIVGRGTVSALLATFGPTPCLFFFGRSRAALHRRHRATLAP